MKGPEAETRIHIERIDSELLAIHVSTPEARDWIVREAPDYGTICPVISTARFHLYVNRCYDLEKVKAYLEDMPGANKP